MKKTRKKCEPGCTCGRHDPAMRERRGRSISKAKKGQPLTPEHIAALKCPPNCECDKHELRNSGQFKKGSRGFPGPHSEETKAKISEAARAQMERKFPGGSERARLIKEHPGAAASWSWMWSRCFDPWNASYPRYGGRGITMCDRWLEFSNFLADMGDRPEGRVQIGRIDHDKDYGPDNCQWEIK